MINTVTQAMVEPAIAARLGRTVTPDGRTARLTPRAVDRAGATLDFAFAPRYGEHTDAVLAEAGLGAAEIAELRAARVIA